MSAAPYAAVLALGAGRAGILPALPEELATELGPAPADPAEAVLRDCAALATWSRAGRLPTRVAARPSACPAEPAPLASPAATAVLATVLEDGPEELLGEWYEAAGRVGAVAAPAILPRLLDHGTMRPAARPALLRVLGERGRWLAGLNPAWAWAVGGDEDTDWETAPRESRLVRLQHLRHHAPAEAVALIHSTWEEDDPADRAAFLATLEEGLGPDDETLLEAALDDRRKEVRETARDLLARLPTSAFNRRAHERVLGMLTGQSKGLLFKKRVLLVEPPAASDKAMTRDGVGGKPPKGVGEKAWWLRQALANADPSRWGREADYTAEAALTAARDTDWYDDLVAGWVAATVCHRDLEWARALLGHSQIKLAYEDRNRLLTLLPPDNLEAALMRQVPSGKDHLLIRHWLDGVARAKWAASEEFSRFVVNRLAAWRDHAWFDVPLLTRVALGLHPAVLAHARQRLVDRADGHPNAAVDRFLAVLALRHTIHEEFPP